MLHEICRDGFDSAWVSDNRFELSPLRLRFLARSFFFASGQFFKLLVEFCDLVFVQIQFCEARLVENPHSCTVFHCLLNVVNVDVVSEDCWGGSIVSFDWGARKSNEAGIR